MKRFVCCLLLTITACTLPGDEPSSVSDTPSAAPETLSVAGQSAFDSSEAHFDSQSTAQSPHPSLEVTPDLISAQVGEPAGSSSGYAGANAEANPGVIGPDDFPDAINPLTGLPFTDPAAANRRPIVAKISNAPPLVRPQSGIGAADIVYEHYVEGGLTRFSAVFYGQAPQRVGSIRSARLIDYDIVTIYDGILAFSGASIGVEKVIYGWEEVESRIPGSQAVAPHLPLPPSPFAERAYKGVLYGPPVYWRDADIPVPHNLYFNAAALWELTAQDGHAQAPDLSGMAFADDPPQNGEPATEIDIRYRATRVLWRYDETSGRYTRIADGLGHFDAETGEQISAANVVVLVVPHRLSDIEESRVGDAVSYGWEILFNDRGPAILFRDGQQFAAGWVSPETTDAPMLVTPDGAILPLKPGNTWYQVVRPESERNPDEEWVRVGED